MDDILGYMKNSPVVINSSLFLEIGAWGRLVFLGGVMRVLIRGHSFHEDGVSETDLQGFPVSLRRKLILLYRSTWLFGSVFLIFSLLATFDVI